jgi:tetratricopeptide (TPR) repeat protein
MTHHFVRAAPAFDEGRALPCALRAAKIATERLAYEEAASHFDQCLELLEFSEATPRDRMSLLLSKGEALARAGDIAAARSSLLEAVSFARELDESSVIVQAAALIARLPEAGTVDPVQVGLLREALGRLPAEDQRRPGLQALLSKSLCYSGELEEPVSLALSALADARKLTQPALLADTLRRCHEALTEPEHLAERLSIAEALWQLARAEGDPGIVLLASAVSVGNCVEVGDMVGVDASLETLGSLAARMREPYFRWYATTVRAMRAYVAGDLGATNRFASQALRMGAVVGEEIAYHTYCTQMCGPLWLTGRIDEAESMARDLVSRYPGLDSWHAALACIELDLGRKARARDALRGLMDRGLPSVRKTPFALSVLTATAELCAQLRDDEAIAAVYDALEPFADRHGSTALGVQHHGPVARHLGILAGRMGRMALAERHFERALSWATQAPSPLFAAVICYWYARVLLWNDGMKDRARIEYLLQQSFASARASGVDGIASYCLFMARRCGVRLDDARPPGSRLRSSTI